MTTYRLLTTCWIDGAIHKRGTVVERPDYWQGPTRSVRSSVQDVPAGTVYEDVPLFECVPRTTSLPVPVVTRTYLKIV